MPWPHNPRTHRGHCPFMTSRAKFATKPSLGSAYERFMAEVDEEIRKAKTAGQDLPWRETADQFDTRQLGAYARLACL